MGTWVIFSGVSAAAWVEFSLGLGSLLGDGIWNFLLCWRWNYRFWNSAASNLLCRQVLRARFLQIRFCLLLFSGFSLGLWVGLRCLCSGSATCLWTLRLWVYHCYIDFLDCLGLYSFLSYI